MNLMMRCTIVAVITIVQCFVCSGMQQQQHQQSSSSSSSPMTMRRASDNELPLPLPVSMEAGRGEGVSGHSFALNNEYDNIQSSLSSFLSSSLIRSAAVLKETFTSRVLEPGSSISLKCTAYGNPLPQVTWMLDGSSLHESTPRLSVGDFVTKSSQVVSYVNITNAAVEDGGLYSCTAANEVTTAVHSARIDITGDPFIRVIKPTIAIEGSPLYLTCPYAGHPIEDVYWEHSEFYTFRERKHTQEQARK